MASKGIVHPGGKCTPDLRRKTRQASHTITPLSLDFELQAVHAWLTAPSLDVVGRTVLATDAAIKYVLDGARSKRLHLEDPRVDKDERSSVGTKLQYHLLEHFELPKIAPLDTVVDGVPVELKTTIRRNWTIPVEGQCQVTFLVRIDTKKHLVAAWLMRTHRAWLNEGTNQDRKRTVSLVNFDRFAVEVVPWTPLPREPLLQLDATTQDFVLGAGGGNDGITARLTGLLVALPDQEILRTSIGIVGGNAGDFMKRAREAKAKAAAAGLLTLVGTWQSQREMARHLGFDLAGEAWVAVSGARLARGAPIALSSLPNKDFLRLVGLLPPGVAHEWRRTFRGL